MKPLFISDSIAATLHTVFLFKGIVVEVRYPSTSHADSLGPPLLSFDNIVIFAFHLCIFQNDFCSLVSWDVGELSYYIVSVVMYFDLCFICKTE